MHFEISGYRRLRCCYCDKTLNFNLDPWNFRAVGYCIVHASCVDQRPRDTGAHYYPTYYAKKMYSDNNVYMQGVKRNLIWDTDGKLQIVDEPELYCNNQSALDAFWKDRENRMRSGRCDCCDNSINPAAFPFVMPDGSFLKFNLRRIIHP